MSRKATGKVSFHYLEAPGRGKPTAGHIALVPGGDVPLLALQLPPGLQGAAREQVAWRQLQDQLGLTPDRAEMHPFVGSQKGASWTRALVADAAPMQRWRDRLDPGCRALLPDYLALPAAKDIWVLALRRGTVQARLGLQDGFSAEPDLAHVMLAQILADAEAPKPKAVLLLEGDLPELAALLEENDIDLLRKPEALASLGLPAPVVLGHGELAADLRIDARAMRRQLRRQLLPWAAALLAAALMLGLWATSEGLKIAQMQRERAAYQSNIDGLMREHFVPTGPLLDVRLQVSRALAARQATLAADTGQLSLLPLIGQVVDVIAPSQAVPEQVIYSQTEGLLLTLKLTDFAALDQVSAALEQAGIAVDRRSARVVEEAAGGVRTELQLQPKQTGVGQ